jgi:tetratricopeptide (TPR) repeat protein
MASEPRSSRVRPQARRGETQPLAQRTTLGLAPPPLPDSERAIPRPVRVPPPLPLRHKSSSRLDNGAPPSPSAVRTSAPEPPDLALAQTMVAAPPLRAQVSPERTEPASPPPSPPAARELPAREPPARESLFDEQTVTSLRTRIARRHGFRFRLRPVVLGLCGAAVVGLALAGIKLSGDGRVAAAADPPARLHAAQAQATKRAAPNAPSPAGRARAANDTGTAVAPTTPAVSQQAVTSVPVIDGLNSKAPSCAELLGGDFAAKVDRAAAYDQTRIGHRELVKGNLDASQTAFCKATLWDDKNINVMLSLTQLLLIRRDATMAAHWAENALKLNPENSQGLALLGDALILTGKIEEARKAWLSSERTPELGGTALRRMVQRDFEEAQRTVKHRDYARAERLLRRVTAFEPEHAAASAALATCLLRLGHAGAAESWALRADTLRPDDAPIQVMLGDIRSDLGRPDAAERHWRRAHALDPNDRVAALRVRALNGS